MKTRPFFPRTIDVLIAVVTTALLAALISTRLSAQDAAPANTGANEGMEAMQRKLDRIVIPRLEFKATPLSDAIEQVRKETRRSDPDPDDATRGINIFIKLAASPTAAASTSGTLPTAASAQTPGLVPVTLTLVNVPVLDALRLIAAQVGDKVKVEQYAVSIVPLTEITERLVTTDFSVPRQAFKASVENARVDAKSWLESQGVDFPPGSSATYLPVTQKLVVRTTPDNLERIKPLVASASAVILP